jgi:hypothetical protein
MDAKPPSPPRKMGYAADPHQAAAIHNGLDHVRRLGANMVVDGVAGRVAGDDWLLRDLSGLQACAPSAVGHIDNNADPVHFRNCRPAQVAEPAVCWLGTAVAKQVSSIVGDVHHPNAQLEEQADMTQFLGDGLKIARQWNAVAGEVQAAPPFALGRLNVPRSGRFEYKVP